VAHRPKAPRTSAPSSLVGTVATEPLRNIAAVLDSGGQIMLGTIKPISDAAVAHDGRKTLAMLRRQPTEAIADLLLRLDAAIAIAKSSGSRVDEINKPSSDVRYEL
jgi:hypothetical protein